MSNEVTTTEQDDGFSGSLTSNLARSNNYLRWTDAGHWVDRDGLTPPSPMLVLAIDEDLLRWEDKKPVLWGKKPLPDVDQLNAAIPQSQWRIGIDGKPEKPWKPVIIVYLIGPKTARTYKFTSPTTGARIAYDDLKEAVITMRALRGAIVVPLVELSEKPFPTSFGMRHRPDFKIVGWKMRGSDSGPQPAQLAPPRNGGGGEAAEKVPEKVLEKTPATKPPVSLDAASLADMEDVEPPSVGEIIDDELPY